MFSTESIKIFVVSVALFASSCGFWRGAENQNVNASSRLSMAEEAKSAIPFASKEPDVYRAEIVLTNYANGEKSERKIFAARHGAKLRCDYENKISFLQTSENEKFSLYSGKKIYAESRTNSGTSSESGNAIKDFLTTEWLNEKGGARFEKLGAENGFIKYRVKLVDAPNAASETLIFIDENLNVPVKQEFYTISGEQKILVFSMELQNFSLEADDKLFELPSDYRKVSLKEFQKTIWLEKFNTKNE